MKYIRNSGKKKKMQKDTNKPESKNGKKKKEIVLSKSQENGLEKQLLEDAKWLLELKELKQFSLEWIHKVQLELLLQCMGKKDILFTNMFGQQMSGRIFKEKGATQILAMIAKMEGHLFDTVKGNIKQTGTIDHQHQHQIELKPDSNRTDSVLSILEQCGALNPPKKLSREDVEVISA